jgi:ribonuclease HI
LSTPDWHYKAFTDGGCRAGNPGNTASAFIVYDGSELLTKYGTAHDEKRTNNYAEYAAIIGLLEWALKNKVHGILVHSDSQLVVNQLNGSWAVKMPELLPIWAKAKNLADEVVADFKWIPREQNTEADALVNEVMDNHFGKRKK